MSVYVNGRAAVAAPVECFNVDVGLYSDETDFVRGEVEPVLGFRWKVASEDTMKRMLPVALSITTSVWESGQSQGVRSIQNSRLCLWQKLDDHEPKRLTISCLI
jgi:hypothetical protein